MLSPRRGSREQPAGKHRFSILKFWAAFRFWVKGQQIIQRCRVFCFCKIIFNSQCGRKAFVLWLISCWLSSAVVSHEGHIFPRRRQVSWLQSKLCNWHQCQTISKHDIYELWVEAANRNCKIKTRLVWIWCCSLNSKVYVIEHIRLIPEQAFYFFFFFLVILCFHDTTDCHPDSAFPL